MHGDNQFQQNWFFWTDIALFSPANPGGKVLSSGIYLRLLLAMVMAGVATAIKRTVLALYFGKKTVLNYKLRMDKILADMLIISDVGELAVASDDLVTSASDNRTTLMQATADKGVGNDIMSSQRWKEVEYVDSMDDGSQNNQDPDDTDEDLDEEEEEDDDKLSDEKNEGSDDENSSDDDDSSAANQFRRYSSITKSLTGSERHFKSLLDRWKEPTVSKKVRVKTLCIVNLVKARGSF